MGEVYRARDTRLNRDVALKVLPGDLRGDPDRIARFTREAQTLAALNHPHIATIHGFEDQDGTAALALELVDGPTLADRIARGPVPLAEGLSIARQVAEALEAAHDRGILHRDLKPSNIALTRDGRVKVLDFGLAKVLAPAEDAADAATALHTQTGLVMGTPGYMSPEQARGEEVGTQSDIWSFGAVLYELLTGVAPFTRRSTAETLATVLGDQPDLTRLPPQTPLAVQRLVRRCLEKDLSRRRQHIGDIRIEIEDVLAAPGPGPSGEHVFPAPRRWLLPLVAVVSAVAAGGVGWLVARQSASLPTTGLVRLSLPFSEPPARAPFGVRHLAISPDGSTLAFVAPGRLWIRRMDSAEAITVALDSPTAPFFSPDGKWVGVMAGGLVKVPVAGGDPVVIAPTTQRPAGGAWRDDGTIVYATSAGLFTVSENGGSSKLLAAPRRDQKEIAYGWPEFVPATNSVLFTIVRSASVNGADIAALDLDSGDIRTIITGGSSPRYVDGFLIYAAGTSLRAVIFDGTNTQGEAVVVRDVGPAYALDNGAADFAVSPFGTLVFLPPAGSSAWTLLWVDRRGREQMLDVEPRAYLAPRISPDGKRAVVIVNAPSGRDVYVLDLERLTQVKVTDGPTEDMFPVWNRDGSRFFFASNRTGDFEIYSQGADSVIAPKLEFEAPGTQFPNALTPDGMRLLIYEDFKDISVLNLASPDRLHPLLNSSGDERIPDVSPDGNWVVYESDESGKVEIVLRSFSDMEARPVQISNGGGRHPRWGPAGSNELYYVQPDGALVAAGVTLQPKLTLGPIQKVFDVEKVDEQRSPRSYDISPLDGRFLIPRRISRPAETAEVSVMLGWLDDLRRRLLQ